MKPLQLAIFAVLLASQLLFYGQALAQDPAIDRQYTLVKKTQASRTEYDFTYRVNLVNGDIPIKNVSASVSSTSANTSVIDGSVAFADVLQAGAASTGLDTFTIRQNRSFPFNPASLVWSVKFDPVPPPQVIQALQALKQQVGSNIIPKWYEEGDSLFSISRADWTETQTEKVPSLSSSPDELSGTPLEKAMAFLRNHHGLFKLLADASDLTVESINGKDLGKYDIELGQTFNGLPVFDRGVAVFIQQVDYRFTLKGITRVNSSYVPNINIPTTPALSADEVIAIAQNDTLAHPLRRPNGITQKPPLFVTKPSPILGIYVPADNQPILAYRFTMNVTEGGLHTAYLINANSGAIISAYDPALYSGYVTGSGRVFDPNPVNTLNRTDLADNDNSRGAVPMDPATGSPYFIKDLLEITSNTIQKQYYLIGPYVTIDDRLEEPKEFIFLPDIGVIRSATPNFKFTRENIAFEHVMAYYVIDTNQRYIQSLGLSTPINTRSIKIDPHGYNHADISAYIISSKPPYTAGKGYITFGQGGVDDAEDADILLHEYGHAIQDNQAPGLYATPSEIADICYEEAGAMAEGFGDYWAASNTADISLANHFSEGPACYAEWDHAGNANKLAPHLDGNVDGVCRRRVDRPKIYPKDYINVYDGSTAPCHENGEIWSSTLWGIFMKLGKEATDKLVLQSHFEVKGEFDKHDTDDLSKPKFHDGGLALLKADDLLFNINVFNTSHKAEICTILKAKGILKSC